MRNASLPGCNDATWRRVLFPYRRILSRGRRQNFQAIPGRFAFRVLHSHSRVGRIPLSKCHGLLMFNNDRPRFYIELSSTTSRVLDYTSILRQRWKLHNRMKPVCLGNHQTVIGAINLYTCVFLVDLSEHAPRSHFQDDWLKSARRVAESRRVASQTPMEQCPSPCRCAA